MPSRDLEPKKILPELARSFPNNSLAKVVFPRPLSPAIAKTCPRLSSKDRFLNRNWPSKPNVSLSTLSRSKAGSSTADSWGLFSTESRKLKIRSAIWVIIMTRCIPYPASRIGAKNSVAINTKKIMVKSDKFPAANIPAATKPEIPIPKYMTASI